MERRLGVVTVLAAFTMALGLSGCSSGSASLNDTDSATAAPQRRVAPTARACPTSYAAPDPRRPQITLTFDLAEDLGSVAGAETVRFTPDLPIHEVVFRLTPNTMTATRHGTALRIHDAEASPRDRSDGEQRPATYEAIGADPATQGGLLVIPLGHEVPAGTEVTARVTFTLTLGEGGFERYGRADEMAWWGTGQPLFAWERGVGWHREPLLSFVGESATSEAADIDLTITAPGALTVQTSGLQAAPQDIGGGRRRWHATADTARDVSVAAGRITTTERTVGSTRLTVGAPSADVVADIADKVESAITGLEKTFGPFPYSSLTVTLLPFRGGGIEYPGSILLLDRDPVTVAHEVAHEWFYGMVGDSQARDPWLDEGFATYAEQLVNGSKKDTTDLSEGHRVGDPMSAFTDRDYFRTVYEKGAAALAAARRAAGPERFDAALRCYVNANAWRIARPADLSRALADLPAALAVLRRAGAL